MSDGLQTTYEKIDTENKHELRIKNLEISKLSLMVVEAYIYGWHKGNSHLNYGPDKRSRVLGKEWNDSEVARRWKLIRREQ